jgi:pyruvate/2-oxoglutarate dehydrogenase complex dihydrolipoamide acyltransferase (E2) component
MNSGRKPGIASHLRPILIEAVVKAIKDFPMINISVEGDKIIKKKDINIGMAVALPDGNLIVPVIHQCRPATICRDLAKQGERPGQDEHERIS